jgi:subtilisin family serine protease
MNVLSIPKHLSRMLFWSALLLSSAAAAATIELDSGAIDTAQRADRRDIDTPLAAGERLLVQFGGPITATQRKALHDAGATLYTYLPQHTYLLRMPAQADLQTLNRAQPQWIGTYGAQDKLGRAVRARASGEDGRVHQVMVQVFPDANLDALVRAVSALGGPEPSAWRRGSYFSRMRVPMTGAQLRTFAPRIAALDDVFWIDVEPYRALLNDTTIWVGQSGLSGGQTTPVFARGVVGTGQTIAVLDTGIDADSCYFRDTALGTLPPTNACNGGTSVSAAQRKIIAVDFLWQNECNGGIANAEWDTQNHGTHVAGTAAGDNFANLIAHDAADGMAPGAKLVIQDGGFGTDNCADLPGIGCPVVDLNPIFQQAYDQGARIHTNSWGDNENASPQNDYSLGSQDVDEFMWNHPDFLLLFAAGNSGTATETVGSPSTAKSAISVGSTLRGASANSISSFSSCGWTDDLRIKPEVTMPGSSIVSAGNDFSVATNNCGTRTSSGTSMATPGAAGLAALIRQYYADGFYPTGAAVPANALQPSAALVRATMINSAVDMGSPLPAIPTQCQGWGRALLDNALHFNGDARTLWLRDESTVIAATGAEDVYSIDVAAGQPFKVTLAWSDFPSTPAATTHLVNNLDLSVSGPGGTLLGNVFSAGQSTAGGSADARNTLEQVLISAPTAGTYMVRVRGANIPMGPQRYALVATGALVAGQPDDVFRDGFE